jgi:transcriptional antiterminator RfaH
MDPMNSRDHGDLTPPTGTAWYCICTKRYKEHWVARQLRESGNEVEVYLPLLRQRRTIRRQLKWVIEPLFPGYLFARFSTENRFRAVRYTPGVAGLVSTCGGWPLEVDEAIIATLQQRAVNGYVEIQPALFSPGEELEVIVGPFQNLRVLFQQEMKAGERVAVLLDLLSSWVRVELPRAYVRKKSAESSSLSV